MTSSHLCSSERSNSWLHVRQITGRSATLAFGPCAQAMCIAWLTNEEGVHLGHHRELVNGTANISWPAGLSPEALSGHVIDHGSGGLGCRRYRSASPSL